MDIPKRILIVEDEVKIAQLIADFLHADQFLTHIITDGAEVLDYVHTSPVDLIILDIMLPNKDGLTLCKEIRAFSSVPILMLTARVDEIDRLMGLGFGADDYVCKPFSSREVVARVQAILKRTQSKILVASALDMSANDKHKEHEYTDQVIDASVESEAHLLSFAHIKVDMHKYECQVSEQVIELTQVEFKLLCTLLKKPRFVYDRDTLMRQSYNDGRIVSHRTIDSHIKNLRNKLMVTAETKNVIHSIYGVGYKIE